MKKFKNIQDVNKFFKNNMCGIGGGGYSECMLELSKPAKYARGIIPAGTHHVECYQGNISICDESHVIASWFSGETVRPFGVGEIHKTPCTWGDLVEYHGFLCEVEICECLSGRTGTFKFASDSADIVSRLYGMLKKITPKPVCSISKTDYGFLMDTYHGLFKISITGLVARHKYTDDIKESMDLHIVTDFMESFKR